jgi:phosphate transport system substrate-binding protein
MSKSRIHQLAVACLAASLAASAVPSALRAQSAAPINISGSSTVGPITDLAIKGFQTTAAGKTVNFSKVIENGTGGGFRDFCSNKTVISNASRPINAKEIKACEAAGVSFYELPVGFDAITVVVNKANTWAKSISLAELRRLWNSDATGKVDKWNEVSLDWPSRPIKLFGPGKDSGTFDYFNKAVNGDAANTRTDVVSSEDDNVLVQGVATNPNALGYFGFAYYKANQDKLRALAIEGPKGTVTPSVKTVQNETYIPLSRPIFIYVNDKELTANAKLRSFVNYYINNAAKLVDQEGSVPLTASQYRLVHNQLARQIRGSAFSGDLPVGLTLGNILNVNIDKVKRPEFRN